MIPKVIHATWKDKYLLNNNSTLLDMGIKKLIKINPSWNMQLSDDSDVEEYLKNNLDFKDYSLLSSRPIIEKIDLWRLLKIYIEGGLYIDIDRLCNKSLDFITDDIKMVLPTCLDYDFSHDFMCSAKNNPIFLKAIQLNLVRRLSGITNIYVLGPQTYMNAITFCILGHSLDPNPGVLAFINIRSVLAQYNFIHTRRENPPYDTIIHNSGTSYKINHEQEKQIFYKQQNIKHWTGAW